MENSNAKYCSKGSNSGLLQSRKATDQPIEIEIIVAATEEAMVYTRIKIKVAAVGVVIAIIKKVVMGQV
jgi:hypothetical protein